METKTIEIEANQAQTQLTELLVLVAAGAEVIITQSGIAVARLLPVAKSNKPRILGLHAGSTWVSDDFDDPLPDEFWLGKE